MLICNHKLSFYHDGGNLKSETGVLTASDSSHTLVLCVCVCVSVFFLLFVCVCVIKQCSCHDIAF